MELSAKLKALRAQHGFSQEVLANQTQLSLRTIQRIEQNETEARGDTIKRLAEAFNLRPIDLINQTEKEETNLISLLNLSALSFIIYPIFGFIVPLVLWYLKRKEDQKLDEIGKKLINFQATWTLAVIFVYAFIIISKIMHVGGAYRFYSFLMLPYGFYALNFVVIMINFYRIRKGKPVIYKPAIPFFKV